MDKPVFAISGDPLAWLMDDPAFANFRIPTREPAAPAPIAAAPPPFMSADTQRFSDVIVETIKAIRAVGDWGVDCAQRRRVICAFAWITGDKCLSDYDPGAARLFAEALHRIPTQFRWGSFDKGPMS